MYSVADAYLDAFKAPARQITGSVACETDNGAIDIAPDGSLIKFTIEKTSPNGKLFGFAVSQKITIEALGILDTIKKGNKLIPTLGSKDYTDEAIDLPYFYVDTIEFNKVKNTTTIVGYDFLHKLDSIPINKFEITYPIYALNYALDIVEPLGGYVVFEGINQLIKSEPNLDGHESARSVLIALAEFTGSICYVEHGDTIKFRSMQPTDFTDVLTADDYYNLTIGEVVTLSKVASGTELGENIETGEDGFTQVIWENPFLNLNDEAQAFLETIGNKVRNLTGTNYTLEWRGCPAYELGDFIILQEKDGTAQYTHYLNETLEYNGGLKATSEWVSGGGEDIEAAPTSITTTMKQTSAKVDKINQEITLLAKKVDESDAGALSEEVAQLKITTDQISAKVSENTTDIEKVERTVETTLTSENLSLLVGSSINSITTTTGFTFDSSGLNITKNDASTSTNIDENGMTIYSTTGEALLDVDDKGITAINLTANEFLTIGPAIFRAKSDGTIGCYWR